MGVPQGSILGPLFFLIHTNDLPDGLKSNAKLFANNTSLFSIVKYKEESATDLTNDLDTISTWAYNWKMSFNPDPKKPVQKVLLSRKNSNISHPIIYFNNVQVQKPNQQKHLSIILDEKLNLKLHINNVLTKTSKVITVIKAWREKCPYSEFFWSVFSPNEGKYGPEKLRIRTLFTQ